MLSDALVFGVEVTNGLTVAAKVESIWAERRGQREEAARHREQAWIEAARAIMPFTIDGALSWQDDGDGVVLRVRVSEEQNLTLAIALAQTAWPDGNWPFSALQLGHARITIELVESETDE
jgi:hypothetical protein